MRPWFEGGRKIHTVDQSTIGKNSKTGFVFFFDLRRGAFRDTAVAIFFKRTRRSITATVENSPFKRTVLSFRIDLRKKDDAVYISNRPS